MTTTAGSSAEPRALGGRRSADGARRTALGGGPGRDAVDVTPAGITGRHRQ
ncbi:hypothetical protein [Streptomyces sp. DSM 40484]|uniref:hypothetical protein n=1 Tax=Streptomyces kroppenstedtii TaxID=3051181 RepID=UPI0028D5EF30|nr:hypothetical protein [Streptomyces sp. DSM 40484]